MILPALMAAAIVVVALGSPAPTPRQLTPANAPAAHHRARRQVGTRSRLALQVLVGFAGAVIVGPLLALGIAVCIGVHPRLRRVLAQRAHRRAIDASWPEAIEMLILVVQAGLTPHQSIEMLTRLAPAPTRAGFEEVCRRIERGAPLADALRGLVDELGAQANTVADTLAMAERYGTPIAVALDQLAIEVRERRRRQAEAAARQLPIRMAFPLVTCTLPSFVLVAIVPAVLASLSSLSTGPL